MTGQARARLSSSAARKRRKFLAWSRRCPRSLRGSRPRDVVKQRLAGGPDHTAMIPLLPAPAAAPAECPRRCRRLPHQVDPHCFRRGRGGPDHRLSSGPSWRSIRRSLGECRGRGHPCRRRVGPPSGSRNLTVPPGRRRPLRRRLGYPPLPSASSAGRATPCCSPQPSATAFRQMVQPRQMPSPACLRRPAREPQHRPFHRHVVVSCGAISTMGWPANRGSSRALRTIVRGPG